VAGFVNRTLRAHVGGLLATNYTKSQMTYDLRRLRRKGPIQAGGVGFSKHSAREQSPPA